MATTAEFDKFARYLLVTSVPDTQVGSRRQQVAEDIRFQLAYEFVSSPAAKAFVDRLIQLSGKDYGILPSIENSQVLLKHIKKVIEIVDPRYVLEFISSTE